MTNISVYRGKCEDNGEWVEGYLFVDDITNETYIIPQYRSIYSEGSGIYRVYASKVIPETIEMIEEL